MYIDLVRAVLEEAVENYAAGSQRTVPEVLAEIRDHIDATAAEHRQDEPDIDYRDPLCRLGYLYRHATANATLFEWVLMASGKMRAKLRARQGAKLHICSVGGGPGTELLGLAKFFLRNPIRPPQKITFTVLDNVHQWAETWSQLADAVETELREFLAGQNIEPPTIAPMFLPFDVLDRASYAHFAHQFSKVDLMVFNYLFSENKARLGDAADAVGHLHDAAPAGCVFAIIDRLEHGGRFTQDVAELFEQVGFARPAIHELGGSLDADEQTDDMGRMLIQILGRPRVKFFTDHYRDPTVFYFTATKG